MLRHCCARLLCAAAVHCTFRTCSALVLSVRLSMSGYSANKYYSFRSRWNPITIASSRPSMLRVGKHLLVADTGRLRKRTVRPRRKGLAQLAIGSIGWLKNHGEGFHETVKNVIADKPCTMRSRPPRGILAFDRPRRPVFHRSAQQEARHNMATVASNDKKKKTAAAGKKGH